MDYVELPVAPPPGDARNTGQIKLYGADAFAGMRRAGRLTAQCLDGVAAVAEAGRPLSDIDDFVTEFARAHDAVPATFGYRGYPYSCCTSVNHVVCHGFPRERKLRDGDIVNVDVTLILDGWHGDSSRMYAIGRPKRAATRLCHVTHRALMLGIAAVRPGGRVSDIGRAIQAHAEAERCSVVRDFCGHGLGRLFHDAPNVLHFHDAKLDETPELLPGMIFTIEPMINLGKPTVKVLPDGWTAVTRDRSLSAQYEHSVGVTEDGCEVFTLSPAGLDTPGPGRRGRVSGEPARGLEEPAEEPAGGLAEAPFRPARERGENEGHRDRLRRRYAEAGADALADHELLELYLFRVHPARGHEGHREGAAQALRQSGGRADGGPPPSCAP